MGSEEDRTPLVSAEEGMSHMNGASMPGNANPLNGMVQNDKEGGRTRKKFVRGGKRSKAAHLTEPLTSDEGGGHDQQWDEERGTSPEPLGGGTEDPFYVFREDLLCKLRLAEEALEGYQKLVHNTDTAANAHEVKDSKKQLKRHVKNAEGTLRDLEATVDVVSSSREKFRHIDDAELHDRRTLVRTSHQRISGIKSDMGSDQVKAKLASDEQAWTKRREGDLGARNDGERENTAFIHDAKARAQLTMRQQDETLDELGEAVTRVGRVAVEINEEINHQNKMLNEFEDDLDDAEEKLGLVMGKLSKMLKTKSKCQLGTILCLSVVVIVLLFLVIYI